MMKRIRILSIVLAMLMLLSLFTACKKDPEEPLTPPDDPPPVDAAPVTLQLAEAGVSDYVIVYNYQAAASVVDAVNSMVNAIQIYIGAQVSVKECFVGLEEEADNDIPTAHEILVGMTTRQESVDAMQGLRSNDSAMVVAGEKLVLTGGSESAIVYAISSFMTGFVYEQGSRYEVAKGNLQDLVFSSTNNTYKKGTYSYKDCSMAGARIDSYVIIYPKKSDRVTTYEEVATSLRDHLSKEAGFELTVGKDSRWWGDYQIVIGDSEYVSEDLLAQIGPDDYYVKLAPNTITDENGVSHQVMQMTVLFGSSMTATEAYRILKQSVFPTSKEEIVLEIAEGAVYTSIDALK